jgi:hypothetical protein
MLLADSLAVVPAHLLNNRIILLQLKAKIRNKTAGGAEAVRWTPNNSPSAWMTTRGICKSATGIWSNWYANNPVSYTTAISTDYIYRRLARLLPASTNCPNSIGKM